MVNLAEDLDELCRLFLLFSWVGSKYLLGKTTSIFSTYDMILHSAFLFAREQQIWEEIGESEAEKELMLLEIERECLDIYQRKVDEASKAKAHLHQSVVAKEAEIAALAACLGEHTVHAKVHFGMQICVWFRCYL